MTIFTLVYSSKDWYYVYILASRKNGTLYIDMTNNLLGRMYMHRTKIVKGFTSQYKVHKLVNYETTNCPSAAITREAIKALASAMEN